MTNTTTSLTTVNTPLHICSMIDPEKLRERCWATIDDYKDEGIGEIIDVPNGFYIYKDNGSKILAVAHMDLVPAVNGVKTFECQGDTIKVPQLDDRLGCHIILDVLPKLGITTDILLTIGEETGNSTAKHFKAPEGKEYNWLMEFDRGGEDTVMYKFHTPEMEKKLKEYGIKVGRGSFTDICVLEDLGVWAVNFAVAYSSNHSSSASFNVKLFEEQLLPKYIEFIKSNKDTKIKHEKKETSVTTYYNNSHYGGYSSNNNDGNNSRRSNIVKPYQHLQRYCYDYITNDYVCRQCGRPYYECTNVYTCGKHFNMDDTCSTCGIYGCKSMSPCTSCGRSFHNSKYVQLFDTCLSCLEDLDIPSVTLEQVLATSLFIRNDAIEFISQKIINSIFGPDNKEDIGEKNE